MLLDSRDLALALIDCPRSRPPHALLRPLAVATYGEVRTHLDSRVRAFALGDGPRRWPSHDVFRPVVVSTYGDVRMLLDSRHSQTLLPHASGLVDLALIGCKQPVPRELARDGRHIRRASLFP